MNNELAQFEYEKMGPGRKLKDQKTRNQMFSKMVQQDSDIDDQDEEQENKKLDQELAKIQFYEPSLHPKHMSKTPEISTSATETSIADGVDAGAQRNIRRVIDTAITRENAFHLEKNQQHHDDEPYSEATGSDNDEDYQDTLRDAPPQNNESLHYIDELKSLRWRHLKHIQDELNRLYDLEEFLDSLTFKNSKSGRKNNSEKARPTTRAGDLQ